MSEFTNGRSEKAPFYEIKQRYCSKLDGNVVMRRQIGTDNECTCMSAHLGCENSKSNETGKTK